MNLCKLLGRIRTDKEEDMGEEDPKEANGPDSEEAGSEDPSGPDSEKLEIAHGKSQEAWQASSKVPIKAHVEGHRDAARKHGEAMEAHQGEGGNAAQAKAHQMARDAHLECADNMQKSFEDSHLY